MGKKEQNVEQNVQTESENIEKLTEEKIEMNAPKVEEQPEVSVEEQLKQQIIKLEEENKNLVEKVKLAQAELINYRRRKDEETNSLLKYANQDIISELILIVDNFESALKKDESKLSDDVKKYLVGFKMMYANLTETLRKFGVEEINRVGEIFDPKQEQALVTDCVEEMEDEAIIEVLQKGYKLKDRVIRPASVKINQK